MSLIPLAVSLPSTVKKICSIINQILAYHSRILLQNPKVSGTIMPDKLNKLAVKGIQFTGVVLAENDPLCLDAFKKYHSRFPLAIAVPGVVSVIQLNQLKMTDNVTGIFKKHLWQREEKAKTQFV